jgi:hypothetical protein
MGYVKRIVHHASGLNAPSSESFPTCIVNETAASNIPLCMGKNSMGSNISLAKLLAVRHDTNAPKLAVPTLKIKLTGTIILRSSIRILLGTLYNITQKNVTGTCKDKIWKAVKEIFPASRDDFGVFVESKKSIAWDSCSGANILLTASTAINSLMIQSEPIWISTRFKASVPNPNGNRIKRQLAKTSVPNQDAFLTQRDRMLILLINRKLKNQEEKVIFFCFI